jgi:hypothetical protein
MDDGIMRMTTERRKWPDDYLSDDDKTGIRCRKCGCRHLETRNTKHLAKGVCRRYKVCRHCGTTIRTEEKIG